MAINNSLKELKENDLINKEFENYNKFGLSNVLTIEKTNHNYFILLTNGTLLSIYDFSRRTLGREIEDGKEEENKIGKVEIKEKIIDVQCGKNHVLALTINGRIYAWGEMNSPQVGHGEFQENNEEDNYKSYLPRVISLFEVKIFISFFLIFRIMI